MEKPTGVTENTPKVLHKARKDTPVGQTLAFAASNPEIGKDVI